MPIFVISIFSALVVDFAYLELDTFSLLAMGQWIYGFPRLVQFLLLLLVPKDKGLLQAGACQAVITR